MMITPNVPNKEMAQKLLRVGDAFQIDGPFFNYEDIQMGNVNSTYKVNYIRDDGSGMAKIKPYLFQRVNTYAFKNPTLIMDNIDKITEHIRNKRPDGENLEYQHTTITGESKTYMFDGEEFWRICNYIPSITFLSNNDPKVVRNTGLAFGDFQNLVSDFDISELEYTIPDFHDTKKRYEALKRSIQKDTCGRVKEVQEEIEYLLSMEEKACQLTKMAEEGVLPLRVTHNDTKINNVLFDEETLDPLSVIDLDTVMPGLVAHDFGDAIRFAANFTKEDSRDLDKTGLDLNVFWAFADGFLSKTAKYLTPAEVESLGISAFVLTCELATRFLDDYLNGDKYFKTDYPGHNLVRARCQIALAKDMDLKLDAMNAIVRGCVEKYT